MVEIPAASARGNRTEVVVTIPESYRDSWLALAGNPKVQKSKQLYVKLDAPKRPRTTGYRSQNSHIHGHAQQIADYTGDYIEDVIAEAKRRACAHGYPTRVNSFGVVVPISERDATTADAAMLIDELHHIASDIDLTLKEYDE